MVSVVKAKVLVISVIVLSIVFVIVIHALEMASTLEMVGIEKNEKAVAFLFLGQFWK